MMNIYKFDCKSNNSPAYSCNHPNDNSGNYYRALDVDRLKEELLAISDPPFLTRISLLLVPIPAPDPICITPFPTKGGQSIGGAKHAEYSTVIVELSMST